MTPKPKRPTAARYHRISVDTDESSSIASQRELTERWCAANGYDGVDYTDEGISGSGKVQRPAWDQMMADIEAGLIDVVIVKDMSRLARNIRQTLDLADMCHIITIEGGVDTRTATGKLLMQLLGTFAEYERELIVQRQIESQRYRRQHGRSVGSLPYGFRNVTRHDGTYRAIDEDQAPVVREMVKNYLAGATLSSEADRLNNAGIRTRRGNKFSASVISQMLDNPAIAGLTPSGDGVITDADGVPILNEDLAIIDLNTWTQLVEARKRTKVTRNNRQDHADMLLSGYVYCGTCGRRCGRHTTQARGKTYYHYGCTADAASLCDGRAFISATRLEKYVLGDIADSYGKLQVPKLADGKRPGDEEPDEENIARRRLVRLEIDALSESIRTAKPTEIEAIAKRITGLRELHDDLPTIKVIGSELSELEYEDYDTAELIKRDPRRAVELNVHRIVVQPANGKRNQPPEDRVSIVYDADVDWDS